MAPGNKGRFFRALNRAGGIRGDERGNIAVIFVLALLPIMAAIGAAVDYSKGANARSRMQATLDSAVLAGAKEATSAAQLATAKSYFSAMQLSNLSDTPAASFTAGADGVLSGSAHTNVPTSFMSMFGFDQIEVSVKAAAAGAPGGKVCILLVDQTSSQTLLANSGAKLVGPDCEIHVRTELTPGIIVNSGATLEVKRVCVKAASIINNGGTIANLERSCAAISDPFAGKMPSVSLPGGSCTSVNYNPNVRSAVLSAGNYCNVNFSNQSSVTLDPGMYGGINFNQAKNVKLTPGLYIVKGGNWNVNSDTVFTGTDVTIYFADSSVIQFNSGVNISLTAPTTGNYANILFYEVAGLSKANWAVNGSSNSVLSGLIYLPTKAVTINSVSNLTATKVTMVFASLILNNINWSITSSDKAMFSSASGGPSRLLY